MSEQLTRKDIATGLLASLKAVVANRKAAIETLAKKEAEGKVKLEKSLPKGPNGGEIAQKNELNADNGVLPGMDKALPPDGAGPVGAGAPMAMAQPAPMCMECGGSQLEPLGVHMGMSHTMCKTCGDVNAEGMSKAELGDPVANDQSQKYSDMWASHNKKRTKRRHTDEVKKSANTVEAASQAVGGVGAKTTGATVNKPATPGATKVPDAFATGGDPKLGKAEKSPFNDGRGTSGKPHEEIPGTDVGVDKARKDAEAPVAGKEISAKGSGGDISKGKTLAKGDFATMNNNAAAALAPKPAPVGPVNNMPQPAGVIPTAREAMNAKQGVTSVATIRQRVHARGGRDANDIARALKPAVQNAPALGQAASNLGTAAQGMPQTSLPGPAMKLAPGAARGQFQASGTGNRAGLAVIKSEGIPSAPKAAGGSKGGSLPAAAPAKTPTPNVPKL